MTFQHSLIAIVCVFAVVACAKYRRNIVLLNFIVSGVIPLHCQDITSLKSELADASDSYRIEILDRLSRHLIDIDPRASLGYAQEGYMLSMNVCDELGMVRNGLSVAQAYRRLGQVDSAVVIYDAILPLAELHEYADERLSILNGYALGFIFKAEYDNALHYLFQSLNDQSSYNDSLSKSVSLTNIGLVYYKLKHYEKALSYYLQSYDYKQRLPGDHDHDVLALNIGLCYAYLQRYSEAIHHIDRGIALCDDNCTATRMMQANFAKGVVYYGLKEPSTAIEFFEHSYQLAKQYEDARCQLDNIDYLSRLYLEQGQDQLAMHYLRLGEKLTTQYRSLNLERIKIYSRLCELFRMAGQYRFASDYQLKYIRLKDSVYSDDLTENLVRIEAGYQERENLAKIGFQKELLALNKLVISRQGVINRIAALLVVVSVAFVVLLWKSHNEKMKMNLLLDQKVDERTQALLASELKRIQAVEQQTAGRSREEKEINEGISRIKAVCDLALKDGTDPRGSRYFSNIMKAIRGLEERYRMR